MPDLAAQSPFTHAIATGPGTCPPMVLEGTFHRTSGITCWLSSGMWKALKMGTTHSTRQRIYRNWWGHGRVT